MSDLHIQYAWLANIILVSASYPIKCELCSELYHDLSTIVARLCDEDEQPAQSTSNSFFQRASGGS